jgi:hypothetical protein
MLWLLNENIENDNLITEIQERKVLEIKENCLDLLIPVIE